MSNPMNRRNVLKNVALAGATALVSTPVFAREYSPNKEALSYSPPIRFAVSSYSYWHFEKVKYPIERVIENAAKIGFDGVEILHRQMQSEEPNYLYKLKRLAFDAGLALPMLSIHQSFVKTDADARMKDIEHTRRCIQLAVKLGVPCIRMNTGSWGTGRSAPDYYQTGKETPLPGYTDEDAIKWCIDGMEVCLRDAEREGIILAIENHWGLSSNIDYLERIYNALKSSPSMGLNLDTGNYVGNPYPQFERLVGVANIIQAKTYYGGGVYYDLDLDYIKLGKIAREKGFKGYVSLEMEGKENPDIAVPKSLEVLRKGFNG